MKNFFALCCFLMTAMLFPGLSAGEWHTDFNKAKAEALKSKRPIYILFTNSAAAPSLALDRTIFNQKKFMDYADRKLVLMKVDFPAAIHLQSKGLQQQNRELREQFKISILPTALLLDANGNLFIDFVKADGSVEKHRRKLNDIMGFDPPKQYTEYIEGFVKKYTPPEPAAAPAKPAEAKPVAKKPVKKPVKKPEEKPQETVDTNIPDENAGTPLIPLNPQGDLQDWLKASTAASADGAEETKPTEKTGGDTPQVSGEPAGDAAAAPEL